MRLRLLLILTTLLVVVVGCSGGGGMPVVPEYMNGDVTGVADLPKALMPDAGHLLWGYWQGTFDLPTKQVEIVRLRQAEFHANLAGILRTKPLGLSYEVKGFNLLKGTASIDVTLTHPYPNSNFRGFDTRGIFMGPGATQNSGNDPSLVYAAPSGCRVLNADGYTRWWNAQEFTTTGMYGYDDDNIIPGFLIPTTTLNPYKYFADCLEADDPVIPNVDMSNRGTFSTDVFPPKLTRNYKIQFPKTGGQSKFGFHYAVDVSWAPPTGSSAPPKPIGDFPIGANCQEPFHINVDTEGSTAWYKGDTERGGDLLLAVEVFDWQAYSNPFGIEDEIESIWIESKTLFGSVYEGQLTADPGSQNTSGIFHFTIPNVTPTGLENQEILITVRSKDPTSYAPPLNGPAYPAGAVLSSYALVKIPIKTIEPDAITVTSPDGGEAWGIDAKHTATWISIGEVDFVNIDLSLDGGETFDIPLAANLENTYKFTVDPVGNWLTEEARIHVSKSSKPEIFDISDENFAVRPYVHISKPNGGELLMAGATDMIEWDASAIIDNVAILVSTNGGQNYVTAITYSTPNTGSYIFYNIPEAFVGDQNRIKVTDATTSTIYDESDANFTILPELEDQIIVGIPNGAEEWLAGTSEKIQWAGDPNIPDVVIKLSKDSGATWPVTIIDPVPNADGEYTWGLIPQEHISPTCRIGVFAAHNPNIFDQSDEVFSIVPPGIEVETPAEAWQEGNLAVVNYVASDIITNVDILLSLDSGATWPVQIADNESNTGSFEWVAYDPALFQTNQARLMVRDHDNPAIYFDESEDFTLLMRQIILIYPNGHLNPGLPNEQLQVVRIGHPLSIQWEWFGNIEYVNITMSLDGGANFDHEIYTNLENAGFLDITYLDFDWLTDYAIWNGTSREAMIRIEAAGNPSVNAESANTFTIPVTLGILKTKNSAEPTGDYDDDGLQDAIEKMLLTDKASFDTDGDGMYDYNELFNEAGYSSYDLIPNVDSDDEITPCDWDDNNDGVHDGELVDSDNDGVPNYLEYYGFTYNWLSGQFLKYDEKDILQDFTVPYFKTDPMQPSTDQDPYGDGMEVSNLYMDQSVLKPGNSPMIPAMPNIIVRLKGYQVVLNADIADTEGNSETQGSSWTREMSQSSSKTDETNWEAGVEVKAKFGLMSAGGGVEVTGHYNWGASHSTTTTTGTSESTSGSSSTEMNWSTTTSTNPSQAAIIKLYLKVYNTGTACASNVIPTMTLCVGKHQVATLDPGNAQINTLPPGTEYPAGEDIFWVVDCVDTGTGVSPIYLNINELRAFEAGAPVSIHVPQVAADVAAMNESGYWEYIGKWGEYMARVDAVCAHLYLDPGDGDVLSYMVYADDDPSAPKVTVRDAFLWSGAEEKADESTILMPYRLPNTTWDYIDLSKVRWFVDYHTKDQIPGNLVVPPSYIDPDFNFMEVELGPDAYIVGKVLPEAPYDKPIFQWAGYYRDDKDTPSTADDENIIFASVDDYFAVKEVWYDPVNYGTNYMMTFDDELGCYKTANLPSSFAFDVIDNDGDGQDDWDCDMVRAKNVFDDVAIPMCVNKIFEFTGPPSQNPKPYIAVPTVRVWEYQDRLALNVTASVSSTMYDISGVYLLNGDDTVICQLSGPATGGSFSLTIDPATYLPDGTERIWANNEGGYQAVVPVSYSLPPEKYRDSWCDRPPEYNDIYYWDTETENFSLIRDAFDDFRMQKTSISGGGVTRYWYMIQPVTTSKAKWLILRDFPNPSKAFIKGISSSLATSPDKIMLDTEHESNKMWQNDSLVFVTQEGRYGYVRLNPSGSQVSINLVVYSLYDKFK